MSLKDVLANKEDKVKPTAVIYTGIYRLVDSQAKIIKLVGDVYEPIDELQINELEYQVTQGRVCKS